MAQAEESLVIEIPLQTETEENNEQNKYNAICNMCFLKDFSKTPAFYICCEKLRCGKCFEGHETHEFIHLVSEESERDRQNEILIDEMMNESESEREIRFEEEKVAVVDRVSVKHEHDKNDCKITGICELNNSRWVVSDKGNSCIKIFKSGSNSLQRYIQVKSEPFDVTEIQVPNEQGVTPTTESSAVSVTTRPEPDKQCMLAVTLPLSYKIVFIDLKSSPAVKTMSIETEKQCYFIEFSKDKIFILCRGKFSGPWCVTLMSTDGIMTQTFETDLSGGWYTHLAVCSGRVFITDRRRNKVFCLNRDGRVEYYKGIKDSGPEGISIDPDSKKVYLCSLFHDKIYRLDSYLKRFECILDLTTVQLNEPSALCFSRDRLYVGHAPLSAHINFVTVVRVL